jgi:hypothetical protein
MIGNRVLTALAVAAYFVVGCSTADHSYDYFLGGTDLSLAKGREFGLVGMAVYKNNTGKNVTTDASWSSSSPDVVEVILEPKPHIVAHQEGVADITANYGNETSQFRVTVTPHVLDGVRVSAPTADVEQGGTVQHSVVLVFSDGERSDLAAGETLDWSSDDETIAYVDANGLATGLSEGKATITAKLKVDGKAAGQGSKSLSIAAYPTALTLYPNTQTALKGRDYQFEALVMFSDGYRPELVNPYSIKWTSSDPTIASVSSAGVVTALETGTATITAELWKDDDAGGACAQYAGVDVAATSSVTVETFPAPAPQ